MIFKHYTHKKSSNNMYYRFIDDQGRQYILIRRGGIWWLRSNGRRIRLNYSGIWKPDRVIEALYKAGIIG